MVEAVDYKYRAFLSYSHKDTRWAKRLHKAIETFRIDQDLVGRETAAGIIPKTLRPVFRDREDFSAGQSLTEQTLAALRASPFLIVLCSPSSAKSSYVNEEIRLFKTMGRGDAIIPVILDGEPGDPERECFPPALRFEVDADGNVTDTPVEILAADVRETGDGRDLAIAKVVARLLRLGTDEVFRRAEQERRRRQRLQFGIAAVIFVLALFGGVITWQNYQKQQTLAEIEALVGKYSVIGEPQAAPGARQSLTEAITSIAQGAAKDPRYQKALALLKKGKPREAEPLLKAVAEDKKKLAAKQSKEAAEAYRNLAAIARLSAPGTARKYYAEAAKLDPQHIRGLLDHGWFQQQAGTLDEAENAFRRILQIGKPGRDDRNLYWAQLGIGDIRVARGSLSAAKSDYKRAKAIAERLAKSDPGNARWQRDLSVSHDRIGAVLAATGRREAALKSYRAGLEIAEHLAKSDPGNARWQRALSISQRKIGEVLVAAGRREAALKSYRASLEIAEHLAKSDAGNARWLRDLSVSHDRIGAVLAAAGRREAALKSYRASFEIAERLAKSDRGNAGLQYNLAISHARIGSFLQAAGDRAGALKNYQTAHGIFSKLTKSDPDNARWQFDLAVSNAALAEMDNQPLSRWRRVVEILERLHAENRLTQTQIKLIALAKQNLAKAQNAK